MYNVLSMGSNYARPKLLIKNFSSKFTALFTIIYELIEIFYEIGKNCEVGGKAEEHILAFQELRHCCETSCSKVY